MRTRNEFKIVGLVLSFLLAVQSATVSAVETVMVYAATSTFNALSDIIKEYNELNTDIIVKVSFASSSTLAKQIEAGAPAQIFISANPKWMDYLQQQNLLIPETRTNLLHNKIVLISPIAYSIKVKMNQDFNFANQLKGKLCLGDPNHVPAGIYAKQGLVTLNWWNNLKRDIVGTKDVRAALVLVEMGECAAGIVYATDAKASDKVQVIAEFPSKTHEPIVYPLARVAGSSDIANDFMAYLKSKESRKVFKRYGFNP